MLRILALLLVGLFLAAGNGVLAQVNLVPWDAIQNPDFENGLSGWEIIGTGTATTVGSGPVGADFGALLTGGMYVYQTHLLPTGTKAVLAGLVGSTTQQKNAYFGVKYLDQNYRVLDEHSTNLHEPTRFGARGESIGSIVPRGAVYFELYLGTNVADGDGYFDKVRVKFASNTDPTNLIIDPLGTTFYQGEFSSFFVATSGATVLPFGPRSYPGINRPMLGIEPLSDSVLLWQDLWIDPSKKYKLTASLQGVSNAAMGIDFFDANYAKVKGFPLALAPIALPSTSANAPNRSPRIRSVTTKPVPSAHHATVWIWVDPSLVENPSFLLLEDLTLKIIP